MKKVVVIAYGFPPVGGGGVQRPVKFVKYLREYGWEPLVLTVSNPSVPIIDESLLVDIPEGTKIFLSKTLEPSYRTKQQFVGIQSSGKFSAKGWLKKVVSPFLLPDIQVLWWPGLFWRLFQVIKNEKPACLFVTAPPFSSFIPAVALGKLFRIPVVIDFRDEWSFSRQQWEHTVKTALAFKVDRILEGYAVRHCTRITAANASYINSLTDEYPEVDQHKCVVITNGYDTDDFVDIEEDLEINDRVTIVYAGTVWKGNSLEAFCSALKLLLDKIPDLARMLRVKIFGRIVEGHMAYLSDPIFQDIIELHGYKDHADIIQEICSADALLLAMTDLPGANKIIVGKVFEYMATGKHIFAIIPKCETSIILFNNYSNMTVLHPDDIKGICDKLNHLIANINSIRQVKCDDISQFSRNFLTKELVSVFEDIIVGIR